MLYFAYNIVYKSFIIVKEFLSHSDVSYGT